MERVVDVTALARAVVDAVEAWGPVFLALVCVGIVIVLAHPAGRQALLLAYRGLSGGRRSHWRRASAGVAIPLLAVSSISVSLALEHELRNGPNRMLAQVVGGFDHRAVWLLQRGTSHFMNTSRLPSQLASRVAHLPGTETVWSQLTDVVTPDGRNRTSLVLARSAGRGTPSAAFAVEQRDARCRVNQGRCVVLPGEAIVDSDLAGVGAVLLLEGRPLKVVAHFGTPASLLNRAVIAVNPVEFTAGPLGAAPYAVVAGRPAAAADLRKTASHSPFASDVEVRTTAQIAAANRLFWAGNGTPIMMILIALILAFGTVAYYASRRAAQERARGELATLFAIGVTPRVMMQAEFGRATMSSLLAGLIAAPIAWCIVTLADSQILGFHAQVTGVMLASATSLSALAGSVTALLLYPQLLRLDIPRAMQR